MNTKIKFGTDGFRGILGVDFTEDAVKKITRALARYMEKGNVVIGYDPRHQADKFAKMSAEMLSDYGFDVLLSNKVVPTPVIAYSASSIQNCSGAIMFTASHNPKEYLGIKFIPNYGGPATSDITNKIEEFIEEDKEPDKPENEGSILKKDFSFAYFRNLARLIDFESIRNNPPKIIYDGLFSASVGYFDEILRRYKIDFEVYNDRYDPDFGGFLPEPKKQFMLHSKAACITVANDGDADRFGVIDETGDWVSPNLILAILLKYLKEQGKEGVVVKTVGVSQIVDIVAKRLNVPVVETAVGFKHVGEAMRRNKTIIGGEDSGGLSVGDYISEKDGIFANLLIIEMLAKTGKPLSQLKNEIIYFAGMEFFQDRVDVELTDDSKKDIIIDKIKSLDNFCNMKISNKSVIDGVKLYFENDRTQILIRKSGTEPLLRFYIETDLPSKITIAKEYIKGFVFALQ